LDYELRDWYENRTCLYTDDVRVKDLVMSSSDLTIIVGRYFKSPRDLQPFAWDIIGPRHLLAGISKRFASTAVSRRL
jgi:hypothetical protein